MRIDITANGESVSFRLTTPDCNELLFLVARDSFVSQPLYECAKDFVMEAALANIKVIGKRI